MSCPIQGDPVTLTGGSFEKDTKYEESDRAGTGFTNDLGKDPSFTT